MPAKSTASKATGAKPASKSAAKPAAKPKPPAPAVAPLTADEERTWAMLAHLSILLNLVTGFLGLAAALVIYLVYQNRSRYVAYQALQSLLFQLVAWIGGGTVVGIMWAFVAVVWTITGGLLAILVGLLCLPAALLITLLAGVLSALPLAAIVYGIVGGIECNQGRDFRYWLVGDWVRGTLTG